MVTALPLIYCPVVKTDQEVCRNAVKSHNIQFSRQRRSKIGDTAKLSVENYAGLLNNRTCALKYHLIKSESPNLQVHLG